MRGGFLMAGLLALAVGSACSQAQVVRQPIEAEQVAEARRALEDCIGPAAAHHPGGQMLLQTSDVLTLQQSRLQCQCSKDTTGQMWRWERDGCVFTCFNRPVPAGQDWGGGTVTRFERLDGGVCPMDGLDLGVGQGIASEPAKKGE